MVPRALSDGGQRVSGLTNRPLARPHVQFRPLVVTEFDAVQIGQIYDFPTGVTGAGTCIGIIELGGGYTQQDLDMYFSSIQIPTPSVVTVSVDGAVNSPGGSADGEVEMDIEVAGSIAPGAAIAVYFAPNSEQGFIDAIYAAIFDTANQPTVLSISWGAPEDAGWTAAGLSGMDTAFATAAAFGITVLAASAKHQQRQRLRGDVPLRLPCQRPLRPRLRRHDVAGQPEPDRGRDRLGQPGVRVGHRWRYQRPVRPAQLAGGQGRPRQHQQRRQHGSRRPGRGRRRRPAHRHKVFVDGQWEWKANSASPARLPDRPAEREFFAGLHTPFIYSLHQTNASYITKGTNQIYPAPGYSAGAGWDACTGLGRIDGKNLLTELQ